MKRLGVAVTLFVVLTTTVCLRAQQPSFAGTWSSICQKSAFRADAFGRRKAASGLMHFDTQGFAYDFDLSGKDFPTPDGGAAAWKEVNPRRLGSHDQDEWKGDRHLQPRVEGRRADGGHEGHKPGRWAVEQTSTWSRVSGGPGFLGKWKSTEVKGAATTMEIALRGCRTASR